MSLIPLRHFMEFYVSSKTLKHCLHDLLIKSELIVRNHHDQEIQHFSHSLSLNVCHVCFWVSVVSLLV